MTTNEAADRLPQTKHGRYVLNIARLWHWAAFDVNDILQIESESCRATVERIRERLEKIEEALPGTSFRGVYPILDEEAAR